MAFQYPKNLAEFQQLISQDKLVVVDFHATWCGPCRTIAPLLEQFAKHFSNVVFAKVDVDEVADVAAECGIRAMPTFLFFKNGEKVGDVVGADIAGVQKLIEKLSA